MIVESKIAAWLQAGLELYKTHPLLIEAVFHDASMLGTPSGLGPGFLADSNQRWLVNEFVGGAVRYGNAVFPILSNTASALTVTGNPSLINDVEKVGYQIVPKAAAEFLDYLQQQKFTVESAFPQMPASFPAFSIRLERDVQAATYLGERGESYILGGVEVDTNRTTMTGTYLISIWSVNRDATLWLYSWLHNYTLRSMQQFATWGLSDVSLGGSDLDPALQFLPERTYVRHVLLTCTRDERALSTQDVEYVSSLCVRAILAYAPFSMTIAQE